MTAIQNTADQFLTGTGRLVSGDPFYPNTTGHNGQPLKDGRKEYFVAVAFPKDQPAATNFDALWALMNQVAQSHKYVASYAQTGFVGFHWKYEDGDSPANADKPDWKGCHVLKFKNGFPPNVFDERGQAVPSPYEETVDATGKLVVTRKPGPHTFPKGHYVRLLVGIKNNDVAPPQSGLYLNFFMIQRVGYGTEIQSGPDYSAIVNQAPVQQLAGMSTMPVGGAAAPAGAVPPGTPGVVAAPGVPGTPGVPGAAPGTPPISTPATPGMAPGVPGAVPAAAPGVPPTAPGGAGVPVGGVPAAPGVPPAAPAAPPAAPVAETPQQRMLVNDATYDAYISQGWTEDLLIAHGKMRAAAPHAYNQ